jgi:ribonuclease HII
MDSSSRDFRSRVRYPPMRYGGIDEAGYGPTLGPLAIVGVGVDAPPGHDLARAFAGTGVRDSKTLHKPGNLAPLEQVALGGLAWLLGKRPGTAAEVFTALGETSAERTQPWQHGAESLTLPLSATHVPLWSLTDVQPLGVRGRLIHAGEYNRFVRSSGNKADLELRAVGRLLAWVADCSPATVVVDRLGGRRFYRYALQGIWPDSEVAILEEAANASSYDIAGRQVSFLVGGESASPLTALASCIAKYARELHMLLFNRHWCAAVAGLAPTAGYPEDARRWLGALGSERYTPIADELVRGWPRF